MAIAYRKKNNRQSSFSKVIKETASEKKIDVKEKEVQTSLRGERKIDAHHIRRDLTKSLALTMLALGIEIGLWYLWR